MKKKSALTLLILLIAGIIFAVVAFFAHKTAQIDAQLNLEFDVPSEEGGDKNWPIVGFFGSVSVICLYLFFYGILKKKKIESIDDVIIEK